MKEIEEVLHSAQQMVNEHRHAYPPTWHKDATDIINKAAAELADKNAVIEAARKIGQSFLNTAEFLMLDNSPCWCGLTEGHSFVCKKMRAEYANLATALAKLDGAK